MVLWEMYERKSPFLELKSRFDIMNAKKKGKQPVISGSCPTSYSNLIRWCLAHNPEDRPTFSFIVNKLEKELKRLKELSKEATNNNDLSPSPRKLKSLTSLEQLTAHNQDLCPRHMCTEYSSKILERCDDLSLTTSFDTT